MKRKEEDERESMCLRERGGTEEREIYVFVPQYLFIARESAERDDRVPLGGHLDETHQRVVRTRQLRERRVLGRQEEGHLHARGRGRVGCGRRPVSGESHNVRKT